MEKIMTDEKIMQEAMKRRLVKIISKGTAPNTMETEIRDAETGELIPNILWANIELDAKHNLATGVLHQAIHVNIDQFEHIVDMKTKPYVKPKEAADEQ